MTEIAQVAHLQAVLAGYLSQLGLREQTAQARLVAGLVDQPGGQRLALNYRLELVRGVAAAELGGALSGAGVRDIRLVDVTVRNVGGWAYRLEGNGLTFEGCEACNTGAGGIGYRGDDVTIARSRIHSIGLVYQSAVGIMGSGLRNRISHCEIFDTPYCGINNVGDESLVEGNLIYSIKTFMQDGGAIYVFAAKRLTMRGNVILGDPAKRVRVNAYYLDERSEDSVVEQNLAVNSLRPVQSHMTRNCTYRNNVFIDRGEQHISAANSSGLTFNKNVLMAHKIIFRAPKGNPEGRQPDSVDPDLTS